MPIFFFFFETRSHITQIGLELTCSQGGTRTPHPPASTSHPLIKSIQGGYRDENGWWEAHEVPAILTSMASEVREGQVARAQQVLEAWRTPGAAYGEWL